MALAEDLTGWCPVRLFSRGGEWRVDWRYLGDVRFSSRSFFDLAIDRAMQRPFTALFWRDTPIEAMLEWADCVPKLPVRGIIHHMSRCGSTLVSKMLGACEGNIALSEPSPLDVILRTPISHEERLRLARAWVTACTVPRFGERAIFIKADCWHFRYVEFLQEAFPEARWIFLYREPIEVIVSHVQEPSPWTTQGLMDAALLDMTAEEAAALSREDYVGKSLGIVLEWAIRNAQDPCGMLVNYSELPGAFLDRILPHFGVAYSVEEVAAMEAAAQQNAKEPALAFEADVERKQKAAKPWMRDVAARWIEPHYGTLEALRVGVAQGLRP